MTYEQRQVILDCQDTFSTISGQRFLKHLEVFCGAHVNQDNFDPASDRKTAYNLGRNRVYRHIQSMIDCDMGKLEKKDCVINAESE